MFRYRRRTVLAIIAIVLLLLITLWRTAEWAERIGLENLHERAQHDLSLFVAHLQGELARYQSLPTLLATEEVLAGVFQNPDHNVNLVNRHLKTINDIVDAADIYLMDATGLTVAASNWNTSRPFVGRNFGFRPYFQEAMQGQLGRYYALGTTSKERGYYFAYPIRRKGYTLGAVVVKISLDVIESAWGDDGNAFIVTDPDGVIFITTRSEWKFNTLKALPRERIARIKASRRYGDTDLPPLPVVTQRPFADQARILRLREPIQGASAKTRQVTYLMQGRAMLDAGWKVHVLSNLAPVRKQVFNATLLAGFVFALLVLTTLFVRLRQQNAVALRRARDQLEQRVKERTADLSESNKRLRREIVERNRAEEDLRQTQDELIQAAKLAGIGQMSAGINHELNQPLSAIRSYADNARALMDRNRQDEAQWNLVQIAELTERMAQIIKQLKLFARKTSEQTTPVSLQGSIDAALSLLATRIHREQARVIRDLPIQDCLVLGDAVRLEQVFVNLIVNALDSMSNSEYRELSIKTVIHDNAQVTVSLRDTGPGIPESHLSRIFDPFFTTKEAGQGLGLGLSISYRIIDGWGGVLKAVNHPEGGAIFYLDLPLVPIQEEADVLTEEAAASHG
ncbi:MAG: ATP-binding protein [Candidatus Competibacteraceae bacterium]|nr:ATP-binding protein [Candidatus Competibacteraceae bacterium]